MERSVLATFEDVHREGPWRNAFVATLGDEAMQSAREADGRAAEGRSLGPLDGVRVAVKDVIDVAGSATGCGSAVRADAAAAERDADCVRRLRSEGAVLLGKTHLHEFALGGTGRNAYLGDARNPHDATRIAGGSSSGSAIAVAHGWADLALGTDTGGSVRGPAALCGVIGYKPTYGAADLTGVVPSAWTLDHVGAIARDLDAIQAWAARCTDAATPGGSEGPESIRLGLAGTTFTSELAEDVAAVWRDAVSRLPGTEFHPVALPAWPERQEAELGDEASWLLNSAEAAAYHEPWLESASGAYGADIRERLHLGTRLSARAYLRAQRIRTHLVRGWNRVWDAVDVLAMPATPFTAPPLTAEEVTLAERTVNVSRTLNRHFRIMNLAGWPAIVLPTGVGDGSLPVAAQLVARPGADGLLLRAARLWSRDVAAPSEPSERSVRP